MKLKLELFDETGSGSGNATRNALLLAAGVGLATLAGYGIYKLALKYLENVPPKELVILGLLCYIIQ